MKIWIPVAILVIVLLAFAGLAPLPGQKDNTTPHTEPSQKSPQVEAPTGPPASPPGHGGYGGTQPPPGGTPGGPTDATSGQTMTGSSPQRGADSTATR